MYIVPGTFMAYPTWDVTEWYTSWLGFMGGLIRLDCFSLV